MTAASLKTVNTVMRNRNRSYLLAFLIIAGLTLGSALITQYDFWEGFASFPKALGWLTANFSPDAATLDYLPRILSKLGETVVVSVMATFLATIGALFFAVLISKTTAPHPILAWPIRALASVLRNIPVVAWAMILLFSFGQSVLTGFIALFLESLGFLIRSFAETIDETSSSPVEALKASGASWGQTVSQAVIPGVLPQITSWMLFMLENNIRSATLVGILTGSGIGFLFDLYYKTLKYPPAALVVLSIVAVVLLLEGLSNLLRRVIL